MRKVLTATRAQVLDGELRDADLRARLAEITGELVGVATVPELQRV